MLTYSLWSFISEQGSKPHPLRPDLQAAPSVRGRLLRPRVQWPQQRHGKKNMTMLKCWKHWRTLARSKMICGGLMDREWIMMIETISLDVDCCHGPWMMEHWMQGAKKWVPHWEGGLMHRTANGKITAEQANVRLHVQQTWGRLKYTRAGRDVEF